MTPYEIMMLIEINAGSDISAPVTPLRTKTIENFYESKLIESAPTYPSGYRGTARSDAFVEHICKLQLPVCKWVMEQD